MRDAFRFLGLAAALGLAAGMVLAAIVLALATPAYADEGILVLRPRDGEDGFAAPLLSIEVVFRISGPVARARVVQTFGNPQGGWYEGVYAFPLPETGTLDRLRLRVGERVIEGEIRQERLNFFIFPVANIGPGETVVVELEYQQLLRYDDSRFSLRVIDP